MSAQREFDGPPPGYAPGCVVGACGICGARILDFGLGEFCEDTTCEQGLGQPAEPIYHPHESPERTLS